MESMILANNRLRIALRHGWLLVDCTRDAFWLERIDGKSPGTIYINPEGHIGYCPF